MKSFRISGTLAAASILFAAALADAAAPQAGVAAPQAPPPIRLAPPKTPPAPGTETPKPPPLLKRPPPLSPDQTPGKIGPTVEVSPLQAIDPDSAGVLDATNGGFGVDMWAGASRSMVERLLPQLPVRAPSPVMRDLARRLLLSIAKAPEGKPGGTSLIALRAERLAAMGDSDGVGQLLDAAPTQRKDEGLSRLRINSQFLAGDVKGACDQTDQLIQDNPTPFWQKAFAFCRIVAGEKEKARLAISLLRESESDKDPAFFALAGFLLGDVKKAPETVNAATPLEIAMLRQGKAPLPASAAGSADPAVLKAIAAYPEAGEDARLAAAERAEAEGALGADALAKIYSEVSFKPKQIDNALTEAEKDGGPRGRALLYQAAVKQGVPAARAEILQEAWKLARKSGLFDTSARVMAPMLFEITPAPELMWFAADAGRALFVSGDNTHAFAWYDMAASAAPRDSDAKKAYAALWPMAVLFDTENRVPADSEALGKWIAAEKDLNEDGWQDRAAFALALFRALGRPMEPADWGGLVTVAHHGSDMPGIALWTALKDAGDDDRIGKTVLFALLALGDKGPAGAGPITAAAAVSGLTAVGLSDDARKLAAEAAVGAGL